VRLPDVRYVMPEAGYLAWLDCRALGLGDDPSAVFLERGRVALSPGPTFGEEGRGFARLNFGTSSGLLGEAVGRMARALTE
jgi:cystathionine beta-lyase